MERDAALTVLSVLSDSPHRLSILQQLGDNPAGIADVSSALEIPRATAKHNLQRLTDCDLVESTGSQYAITTFGRYVCSHVDEALDSTMVSKTLLPFLSVVPKSTFDVALSRFRNANVTTVTQTNPHAPVERLLERVRGAGYLRIVTPVVLPRLAGTIQEHVVDRGYSVDLIVPQEAYDAIDDDGAYAEAIRTGRLILGVTTEPVPYGLFLLEDAVVLVGHDEENILRCTVETDNTDAVTWGSDTFRRFEQTVDEHVWHDADHPTQ